MTFARSISLTLLATLALVGPAFAGKKQVWEVVVNGKSAYGALGSARNSNDDIQHIGCRTSTYANKAWPKKVVCEATDAKGNHAICGSEDPDIIATAASLTSDSYLEFFADEKGDCGLLFVGTASELEPKK